MWAMPATLIQLPCDQAADTPDISAVGCTNPDTEMLINSNTSEDGMISSLTPSSSATGLKLLSYQAIHVLNRRGEAAL